MRWGKGLGTARGQRTDRIGGWFTGALLLHVTALAGLAAWARLKATSSAREAMASPAAALSIDLEWEESTPPQQMQSAAPGQGELTHTQHPLSRRPSSAISGRPGAVSAPAEPEPSSEPEGPAAGSSPLPRPGALSLAQLGVGTPSFPYPLEPPAPPSETERAEQRLNASLSASLALGDSAHGVGMEGPALRAVSELVMNSALPLTATARLLLVVNGSGRAEAVSLLEVGADRAEWQRIADALHRKLATQALRMPAGSAGARLQLLVSSRALSTSGAEPGLDAELFGKARRTGPATVGRLSILPHEPETARAQFPVFETSGPKVMSGFSTNLLSGAADVADVGGGQRRHVSAQLASLDVVSAAEQTDAGRGAP